MTKKKKSWYAVKKGRTIGIFPDWETCKKQVIGYPNSEYKGFYSKEEAEAFFNNDVETDIKSIKNNAVAYIDGSYIPTKPECFSFGIVFIYDGKIEKYSKKITNKDEALMRNVAGEIYGAICAINLCIDKGISQLDLYYDYSGIEKWCLGKWNANKNLTKELSKFYESIKTIVNVKFHKVVSHTGIKYNDMADLLAKEALLKE